MELSRRKLLTCSTLSGITLGTSGCLSGGSGLANLDGADSDVTVKFEGSVSSEEPLVENTNLSAQTAYPHQYSAVVLPKDDRDEIRWDYVRQEIPLLVDDLEATDFESQFLVVFGMILPETKQLQSGAVSLENGTLRSRYRIGSDSSGASGLTTNTYIRRLEPVVQFDDVKFEVVF